VAAGRYSAGRIFLQVVPSFKNVQRDTKREVEKLNSSMSKDLDKAAEETGHKAGRKAGSNYLMGFEKQAVADQKALNKTMQKILGDLDKANKARYEKSKKAAEKVWNDRRAQAKRQRAMWEKDEAKAAKARAAREEREQAAKDKAELRAIKKRQRQHIAAINEDRARTDKKIAKDKKAEEDYTRWWERQIDKREAATQRANERAEREARRAADKRAAIEKRASDAAAKQRAKDDAAREKEIRERMMRRGGHARAEIEKTIGSMEKRIGEVDLTTPIGREMDRLKRKMKQTSHEMSHGLIDADEGAKQIQRIGKEYDRLAGRTGGASSTDRGNMRMAAKDARELGQALKNADNNGNGFSRWLRGATRDGDDGANAFRIFNYRIIGLASILPLIVPLLAVASAGIVSLATAALGGAAAVGVMVLAFSGVFAAVKALGDVQDNAAKDQLANTKAMRTASRGVRDAAQGLAQARLQAARSAEDSNRRIADAEKNLAKAQKDATKAQQDLRQARKDAQADQDALADRIKGGALDERQALIDLFNAQVQYNAAMADGGATNLEKEQASIDLERAQLAIKGIRKDNAAMAAEQAKFAKQGVNGQDSVKSAQEQSQAAAENVRDAEQAVKDARQDAADNAVDNARSIRDAQERVTDAQAAYQEALTKTGDIGSSSMHNLEVAMGKLSPAGRKFALYLHSLRDDFHRLRDVAQENMLPGVQTFMETMMKRYGPGFERFVGQISKQLGGFFVLLGDTLASPVWTDFFDMMERNQPLFTSLFSEGLLNIATGFAALMTAFEPFTQLFGKGMLDATKSFADWAASLKDNKGFQSFLDYLIEVGPKVWRFFKSFVGALVAIGIAMAPIAGVVLDAFTALFEYIADMDPDTLAAIVTGVLGFVLASQAAAGSIQLIKTLSTPFHSVFGAVVFLLIAAGAALVYLYQHNEKFRESVQKVLGWIKDNAGMLKQMAIFLGMVAGGFLLVTKFILPAIGVIKAVWSAVTLAWRAFGFLRLGLMLLGGPVTIIIGIITALGLLFIWLWNNNETFKNGVLTAWAWIQSAATFMWENVLKPIFTALGAIVVWLWDHIIKPYFTFIFGAYKMLWEVLSWAWGLIGPVFELFGAVVKALWDNFLSPIFGWIGDRFGDLADIISNVWTQYIEPVLDQFGLGADDLRGMWATAIEAIGGLWDGLVELVKAPLRFIVDTIINRGFVDNFNTLADYFGTSHIDHLSLSWLNEAPPKGKSSYGGGGSHGVGGYATGGYTGQGAKYEPAGIVHKDEYVIRKESTNRLRRRYGLGALNYINQYGELPGMGGYASGGLVGNLIRFGHLLQEKGFHVTENPAFGGVNGSHSRTGWHYKGGAIDVNWPNGQRQSAEETAKINAIVGLARQYGLRTLWQWKGHYDHAHFDIDKGPDLGNFAGAGGGRSADLPWWIEKPYEFIKDKVQGFFEKIPGAKTPLGKMLTGFPVKMLEFAKEKIANLINGESAGDFDNTGDGGGFSGAVMQWRDEVVQALKMVGQPVGLADTVLRRLQQESGGNPRAINLWDSNARAGIPSKGLMQVIDPTFATWRDHRLPNDVYNPMSNIVASMRYAMNRYGSLANAYNREGGYADGGLVTEGGSGLQDNGTMMYDNGGYLPPGITTVMNLTGRPEPVFTADQWDGMGSGRGGGNAPMIGSLAVHEAGASAHEVVDEIMFAMTATANAGKYGRNG